MPLQGADLETQAGASQGLWTHSPVDWAGNEPPGTTRPAGWPLNAAQGYMGPGTGTRPGGAAISNGPAGTVSVTSVSFSAITSTGFSVTYSLSATPTSSRVNYGVTTSVTSQAAGTTGSPQTVLVAGLTTKTTYYVSVQTTNGSGTNVTNLYTVTTA